MIALSPKGVYYGSPPSSNYRAKVSDVVRWMEATESLAAGGGLSYVNASLPDLEGRQGSEDGQFALILSSAAEAGVYEHVAGEWQKTAPLPTIFVESVAAAEAAAARDAAATFAGQAGNHAAAALASKQDAALIANFDPGNYLHNGNGGAGSGFDADKLDGLHASSFFRKDANEPLTDRGGNQIIMQGWAYTGDNRYYFVPILADGSDWDWANQFRWNRALGRWEFSGVVTVQGQPVWHKGNDGSGSGLNADKLDGLHASSFMRTFTSGPHALVSGGQITFAHGLGKRPRFIHYTLECLSAERGYSVGDFVAADGAGGNATNTRYVSAEWDDTDVRIRMGNDPNVFAVAHKTTGAGTGLTNSKWQVHVEVAA